MPAASACRARISDGLAFVAIGDWGGKSSQERTTESQLETAVGLTGTACRLGANFSLLLGDNFYQHGIDGPAESSSCRFRDTFEEVYAGQQPGGFFYACAGNHDYGEFEVANVSSQLAFSTLSAQWRFPSLWYKIQRGFSADGKQRSLDVLMIDTVVLCGNGHQNEAIIDEQLQFLGRPADAKRPGRLRQAVAERQWAWLERELRGSTADFLLVAGHYPIWSAGIDGSSQCLIDQLRPMLVEHGAHYLSGHDHMLEHFVHEGLNTFVAGAGKECCYPPVNLEGTPPGALRYMLAGENGGMSQPPAGFAVHGGFAAFAFGAETMEVSLHAHDGSVLYAAPSVDRRWRAGGPAASPGGGAPGGALQRTPRLLDAAAAYAPLLILALGWRRWQGGRGPRGPAEAPLLG